MSLNLYKFMDFCKRQHKRVSLCHEKRSPKTDTNGVGSALYNRANFYRVDLFQLLSLSIVFKNVVGMIELMSDKTLEGN